MKTVFAVIATVLVLVTNYTLYAQRGREGFRPPPSPEWRQNEEARGPRPSRARRLRMNFVSRRAQRAQRHLRRPGRGMTRPGRRMTRLGQRMRVLGKSQRPRGVRTSPRRHLMPSARFLIVGLGLDENQLSALEEIREKGRATRVSLLKDGRSIRKELRAQLKSDNPDPATVGALMISSRAIRPKIKEATESMKTAFRNILTEDQLKKWQRNKPRPQ